MTAPTPQLSTSGICDTRTLSNHPYLALEHEQSTSHISPPETLTPRLGRTAHWYRTACKAVINPKHLWRSRNCLPYTWTRPFVTPGTNQCCHTNSPHLQMPTLEATEHHNVQDNANPDQDVITTRCLILNGKHATASPSSPNRGEMVDQEDWRCWLVLRGPTAKIAR